MELINNMELINMGKKDAWKLLNGFIKAQKLMKKRYKTMSDLGIYPLLSVHPNNIQMMNLTNWCLLLDMPHYREDWDGNEQCNSNYDIIYFDYKGYRFFELVDKERVL